MTAPVPPDPPEPAPGGPAEVEEREPDPRFSYANERTFLAWIRTALGLITAGLVVTQLFPKFDLPFGRRLIGLPMIGLGVLIALFSYTHWQRNETAMRRGEPLPGSFLPRLVAIVVSIVAVIGFFLVLWDGIH